MKTKCWRCKAPLPVVARFSLSLLNLTLTKPATVPLAKKTDLSENSRTWNNRISCTVCRCSFFIGIHRCWVYYIAEYAWSYLLIKNHVCWSFQLIFISGDWSRIGVISKENLTRICWRLLILLSFHFASFSYFCFPRNQKIDDRSFTRSFD